MGLDRSKQLVAEGFELAATRAVALPFTIWKVNLEVEFDRELRLAEETVLRLIAAGVTKPDQISSLMGLSPGVIVQATIVNLLRKGLVSHIDVLAVTPLGRQAIHSQIAKGQRTYEDIHLEHDPYRNSFQWKTDEASLKSHKDVKEAGLHSLPIPVELTRLDVETRHREIQELLERFGLPHIDKPEEKWGERHRDIIRLTALHSYPTWREAQMDVWYSKEQDSFQWCLRYKGGEDQIISDALKRLEKEGAEILPLESITPLKVGKPGESIHKAVEQVAASPKSRRIAAEQHRDALRDAILEARRELIIVSPWLRTAAVDSELLGWLQTALDRQKELQIIIGYGIEQDVGKTDWHAKNQREALRRLNQLGQRKRNRIKTVEIGNTHEKVIVCDERYAIITSYNFLSLKLKPERGVRRETGYLVDDPKEVAEIRADLLSAMKE